MWLMGFHTSYMVEGVGNCCTSLSYPGSLPVRGRKRENGGMCRTADPLTFDLSSNCAVIARANIIMELIIMHCV